MKYVSDRIFIAAAVFMMAVLLGGMFLQDQEALSYYENRSLEEFPAASAETVLDGAWFGDIESSFTDHAVWREEIQAAGTWVSLNLARRPVVNDVVAGRDILLSYNKFEYVDGEAVRDAAKRMTRRLGALSDVAACYGGTYCYVGVPCQYAYFEDAYPSWLNDRAEYTEASRGILEEQLEDRGVYYLDLGPVFEEMGNPEVFYSKVDNHFSMFGAYAAYKAIVDELNRLGAADRGRGGGYRALPVVQEEELTFSPVDAFYMGSRTRKLFGLIDNEEKLYVAEPLTPVPFTRTDYGRYVPGCTGVYLYPEEGEPVTYADLYMGGDFPMTRIETNRPSLPDVLIYGDSFTNPVECLLYLSCDTMYSVDLRHYDESSLADLIVELKPDYVICLRDYESLLSTSGNGGR